MTRALAIAIALLWGGEAVAHRMPCNTEESITSQLEGKYSEAPRLGGLDASGNLLRVYVSKGTGTFTVVSTSPWGMSCIAAAGKHWQIITPKEGPGT